MKSKKELRTLYLKKRAEISSASRDEQSLLVQKKIMVYLPSEGLIASYYPINHELNVMKINQYLAKERRLILPFTHSDYSLSFYLVNDLLKDIRLDEKGIPAPNPDSCPEFNPGELKAAIVPGIAFDIRKYRLGYGKGCYDQFLKPLKKILTIGVTFEECIVRQIPAREHDVPMNIVLSSEQVIN